MLGIYAPDPGNVMIPYHLMMALAGNMSSRHHHYLVDMTDGAALTAALTEHKFVSAADGAVGPDDTSAFIQHWEKFLSTGATWREAVDGAAALAQAKPLQRSGLAGRSFLMRGSSSELRDIFCSYAAVSSSIAENRRLPHGMRTFFEKLALVPNRPPAVYVLAITRNSGAECYTVVKPSVRRALPECHAVIT